MSATAAKTASPAHEYFALTTPYMKEGRIHSRIAKSDNLEVVVKVIHEGGENALHTHIDEDHMFVVLEGQVSIFDEDGNETTLTQYQGVLLRAGAFYRYHTSGTQNAVLLRTAARLPNAPKSGTPVRLHPDGHEIVHGPENKNVPPVVMPGKFFAEEARLK